MLSVGLAWALWRTGCTERPPLEPPAENAAPPEPPPLVFGFPTPQTRLTETNAPDVFMPTASSRPESALYGSVRTVRSGKTFVPSFHEGVDIAPTRRARDGQALDDVFAVADGTVAHLNRVAGNSDYGLYAVLLHADPAGPLYSLYAHLAEIEPTLRVDHPIARGARIGRMGRTPHTVIPVERSHLHFELGVKLNSDFRSWFRRKKLTPDHGNFNGWNLAGIHPLAPFFAAAEGRPFRLLDWIEAQPAAFEVVARVQQPPPFFALYPATWKGDPHHGGPIVIAATAGGVPLSGRNATDEEIARLGTALYCVVRVDAEALGRNGRRLALSENGRWVLGPSGRQWLDILTWRP